MKGPRISRLRKFAIMGLVTLALRSPAASTINLTNNFSYGANIGWADWRPGTNGAVITDYVCSGSIYSANVGWIDLGHGTPTNGIHYQNTAAADFGVNMDAAGKLRGYAYGANIGWITFEDLGQARIDLLTGKFSGHCYSANCGWIALSNVVAHVQTDVVLPGPDLDGDGMADAWELLNFGTLAQSGEGDVDGDGATNLQEYLAGTNPNDAGSLLAITSYSFALGGTNGSLTWQSVLTRQYFVEQIADLNSTNWFDGGFGLVPPDGATTTRALSDTNFPARFLRIRAIKPLSP